MVRFIILSTQRSGSTWLVESLTSHPSVVCHGELFIQRPRQPTPPWGARGASVFEAYRSSLPWYRRRSAAAVSRYLDGIYSFPPGVVAVGFKLMYGQLEHHPALMGELRQRSVRVVHLLRSNALDVIISKRAAAARGLHHLPVEEPVPVTRLQLDAARLPGQLERQEREQRKGRRLLERLQLPTHDVEYETLLAGSSALAEVLEFLGVPAGDVGSLSPRIQRILSRRREETIENFDAVTRALRGTRYERYLGQGGDGR